MRGHENVLKRLLIHASAFNLALWMRTLFGIGTARALQGRVVALRAVLILLWTLIDEAIGPIWNQSGASMEIRRFGIAVDTNA